MKLKLPFFLSALLSAAFLFDGVGFMRFSLASALLHEAGHIAAFTAITKKMPTVAFFPGGISIGFGSVFLNTYQDIAVTLSGPCANILVFIVCVVIINIKASLNLYFFAATNIFFAVLNLLPFSFLDGGRIISLIIPPEYMLKYNNISLYIGSAFIFAAAVFIMQKDTSVLFKLSGIIFMLYFFIKTFFGDKLH